MQRITEIEYNHCKTGQRENRCSISISGHGIRHGATACQSDRETIKILVEKSALRSFAACHRPKKGAVSVLPPLADQFRRVFFFFFRQTKEKNKYDMMNKIKEGIDPADISGTGR